jgi:non-ribosomal peptide synthetase component E (peptide arylation enzyme)
LDAHAGEVPCAFVQLEVNATFNHDEIKDYLKRELSERASVPVSISALDALPVTAVGKVFKPELRRIAAQDAISATLEKNGHPSEEVVIKLDAKGRLVAVCKNQAVSQLLEVFPITKRLLDENEI